MKIARNAISDLRKGICPALGPFYCAIALLDILEEPARLKPAANRQLSLLSNTLVTCQA